MPKNGQWLIVPRKDAVLVEAQGAAQAAEKAGLNGEHGELLAVRDRHTVTVRSAKRTVFEAVPKDKPALKAVEPPTDGQSK